MFLTGSQCVQCTGGPEVLACLISDITSFKSTSNMVWWIHSY